MTWNFFLNNKSFTNLEKSSIQYIENPGQREYIIQLNEMILESFPPVIHVKIELINDDGSSTILIDDDIFNYHIAVTDMGTSINIIKNK